MSRFHRFPDRKDVDTPGKLTNEELHPRTPTGVAVRAVASRLLSRARECEAGIICGTDPEFLHVYRVSLRKIRSILAQLGGGFPPDVLKHWKKKFRGLGKKTNTLRDLDVDLAARGSVQAALPPELQSALEQWFCHIQKEREREVQSVQVWMKSASYTRSLERLASSLDSIDETPGENRVPIAATLAKALDKRFKKIVKAAGKFDETTTDEKIHRLRIQCKKLRYVMDVATPLLDPESAPRLMEKLRQLQDGLGAYNDCSVQRSKLFVRLHAFSPGRGDHTPALVVGGLAALLFSKQSAGRESIASHLKAFASPRTQKIFAKLLEPLCAVDELPKSP